MRTYAGIGSRETPPAELELMSQIAYKLSGGWDLRTGGAGGADSAFIEGAVEGGGGLEIYLPWPRYAGWGNPDRAFTVALWEPSAPALDVACRLIPYWSRLHEPVRKLMARNVHIIVGPNVDEPEPVSFVACWTKDGADVGGTGFGLLVARTYGVPVLNLAFPDVRARIGRWLDSEPDLL